MDKLATLQDDGWTLDCGETLHDEAPETFWIPARETRESLDPGAIVKLVFRIALRGMDGAETEEVERMWVIVRGRIDRFYRGELDNNSYCTNEIRAGMEVFFEPRHAIQIGASILVGSMLVVGYLLRSRARRNAY